MNARASENDQRKTLFVTLCKLCEDTRDVNRKSISIEGAQIP